MILADSSVWIDHLKAPEPELSDLLRIDALLIHRFVIAEIALGSIRERERMVRALEELPHIMEASHSNVMTLIETGPLFSRGIGYVDAHLLAALKITPQHKLWTRDKRLAQTAALIGVELYE